MGSRIKKFILYLLLALVLFFGIKLFSYYLYCSILELPIGRFESYLCAIPQDNGFQNKDKGNLDLLLLSGTIFSDDSVKFDEWYKINGGIPTQLSGETYAFSFIGLDGGIIDSISYDPSFSIDIDPIGSFEIGAAPFSFAISYPNEFVSKIVLSHGDQILASIDPNAKLLRDAITLVPDYGFIDPSNNRRTALLQKIDVLEIILERGDRVATINKLKNDIRVHVVEWLTDYTTQSPLQLSKIEIIKLIDDILVALQNNSN